MENQKYNLEDIRCFLDKAYDKYVKETITDEWLEKQASFDSIYEDARDFFIDIASKQIGTDFDSVFYDGDFDPVFDICCEYTIKFTKLVHSKLEAKFGIYIDFPFPSEQDEIDSHVDFAFFRGSVVYGIEPADRSDVDVVAVVDDYISLPKMYSGDYMYERPDE